MQLMFPGGHLRRREGGEEEGVGKGVAEGGNSGWWWGGEGLGIGRQDAAVGARVAQALGRRARGAGEWGDVQTMRAPGTGMPRQPNQPATRGILNAPQGGEALRDLRVPGGQGVSWCLGRSPDGAQRAQGGSCAASSGRNE